jgi:hypothetical protein
VIEPVNSRIIRGRSNARRSNRFIGREAQSG